MSFTPTDWLALDTNEYLFGLRDEGKYPFCRTLLFEYSSQIRLYIPGQVVRELENNLTDDEAQDLARILRKVPALNRDFTRPSVAAIQRWHERGAKKGDAVIAAQLEAAGIRYLVSENRHFLAQIQDLPFEVMDAATLLRQLR